MQSTWMQAAQQADAVAKLFYTRLFEIAPEVRPLFKGELEQQGRKLMAMLAVAVNGLPKLDQIVPAVQDLGRRHHEYGVEDEDYESVGEALLWTLEQGLGEAFTEEARDAWTLTYTTLADVMKAAAPSSAT
ncbi:globin family protein [Aeoliella mucimassa]|uniref:globin family protein n=1 Tax=Aeoliella mucimassa TaxID=2527972 RepID=UPI0018D35B9C|nr:globin family protein [Aeoliella mucimassa]